MIARLGLYTRTLRHLRGQQVLYQFLNRFWRLTERGSVLRIPAVSRSTTAITAFGRQIEANWLTVSPPDKAVSYQDDTFTFLNQSHSFGEKIDWNWARNGKLWTYNLTYFDFLNQPGMTANTGLRLIRAFIAATPTLRDGLEPYPTSLRLMNWIRFLSYHRIYDANIDVHLLAQMTRLRQRLEFHLAGNHLLENAFALTYVTHYFRLKSEFKQATNLLRAQLGEQVLADGGHDERSPMYHQILLDRLLDVLLALESDTWPADSLLTAFLTDMARRMLTWLDAITFADGSVPMVNDAAVGIAPSTVQLRQKAAQLPMPIQVESETRLGQRYLSASPDQSDSGYRRLESERFTVLADVGLVGPDHQPGHAHADTLSFLLYADGKPVLVDTGTSTYEIGSRRTWERSTAAHNTLTINDLDSSEVWGGFRVGRRARVSVLTNTPNQLTARHDGYRRLGIWHQRSWKLNPDQLTITDQLLTKNRQPITTAQATARFYVHPDLPVSISGQTAFIGSLRCTFSGDLSGPISTTTCELAEGFNRVRSSTYIIVSFRNSLITTFQFV